jgi:flagellar hook protein FlgE
MDSAQIGQYGEQHVAARLRSNGYTTNQNTRLPGSTDIEADGKESILVQVKTAVSPNQPSYPSSDEIRNIKSRASNSNRTAYVAQVMIDSSGNLVGEIKWSKP